MYAFVIYIYTHEFRFTAPLIIIKSNETDNDSVLLWVSCDFGKMIGRPDVILLRTTKIDFTERPIIFFSEKCHF